ncbi:MAG: hypothetical protein H6567_12710 [Lewinellaceae bacterium]|nr:hypothetical protein [Lewinellaceae bacterium]
MSSKVKTNNLSNYNPALDQYSNLDLFPEKTKKAKEVLNKPGVKEWLKNIEKEKKLNSEKITKP